MEIKGKKIAYLTLGCKLNFSETSQMRRMLEAEGAVTVEEEDGAEIFVVNSCAVTNEAERKCRQLLHKLLHRNPDAGMVVTGCYAQLRAEEVAALPGVILVLPAQEKFHLVERLAEVEAKRTFSEGLSHDALTDFHIAYSYGDRTRSFLKIQDGCNYFCTYCTVPAARGKSRSASVAEVMEAVNKLASEGIREVILTGVNTGEFGRFRGESLLELMHALDQFDGIERYRISSIEPNLLTEEMIEFVAASHHFMPHFHIPLQAGSDEVLRLMHRRYTTDFYAERIAAINAVIPDAFIGVDVIAGMRGETPELFDRSEAFLRSLSVAQLHVFPYSERKGTKALEIPYVVPMAERHARVGRLMAISEEKHAAFRARFTGTERPVLFESVEGNTISGFTDNYIRVEVSAGSVSPNTIQSTLIL